MSSQRFLSGGVLPTAHVLHSIRGRKASCRCSCSGDGASAAQERVLPMFLLWRRGSCRSGACPADAPALEA